MAQIGLLKKEISAFLGVNLRRDRLDLADQELAKSINADLFLQPGTIVLRLGKTAQFTNALNDKQIRRLALINNKRYQIAGQTVYRDQTSILTGLSSELFTTLVPFRPLNDSQWVFIADDDLMRKDDGAIVRKWGIAAPTVKPAIAVGSKGSLTGTYSVKYTYLRKVNGKIAHESNPSPSSDEVTAANNNLNIDVTEPTDPQVTDIRVYRTLAGGTDYLFDAEQPVEISVDSKEHGFSYDFENDELNSVINPASGYTGLIDADFSPVPTYQFTIQFSDATKKAGTQAWEDGLTDIDGRSRGIFPFEYLELGQDSLMAATFGLVSSGTFKFTISVDTRDVCFTWERDHLNDTIPLVANNTQVPTNSQQSIWVTILSQPDSALGTAVETDNNVPPNGSWATEFGGHVFITRDASNPHYLWWSKRFRPEAIPLSQFVEIGNPSDPLQCAIPIVGLLGVFSRLTKYRVSGNATNGFAAVEAISHRGTPSPLAAIPTEIGVIFVSRDGIFATNFMTPDIQFAQQILPLFFDETINGFSPINWNQASKMSAAVYKNKYYFSYASGEAVDPDTLAVFSNETKSWYFYDHPLRSLFVEEENDDLIAGGLDGFVFILEDGSTDAGTAISLDVETKDFHGEAPTVRKLFRYFRLYARVCSTRHIGPPMY